MTGTLLTVLTAAWAVLTAMAPYLLFGFLVAGVLSVLVSAEWVERHLGGDRLVQIFKAALLGVPLPLCSCGVIPVGVSLRRHGASKGATTAFLLSTPQTGVDSISVTYALLGPFLAVYRPIAALVTGFVGGTLVHVFDRDEAGPGDHCGSDDGNSARPDASPACGEDCACDAAAPPGSSRVLRALRYGFVTLPRDIGKALLVGIAVSGLLSALVPPDTLRSVLGGGILPILAAMAIGVPLYVCATASVPIAVGLIHAGLSPGAALAFLISGPATNAATLATLWKILGRRTAVIYLLTVAVGAVASGLLVDSAITAADVPVSFFVSIGPDAAAAAHAHHHESAFLLGQWFRYASVGVLLAVLVGALWPVRSRAGREPIEAGKETVPVVELKIGGMRCQGCVQAVTRALREVAGVTAVEVDLGSGAARVDGRPAAADLRAAVESLGYTLEEPQGVA